MIEVTYVYVLLGIGLLFNFLGVVGLHRFPDAYTRLHAATNCTTFGSLFIGASVIIYYLSLLVTHTFFFESHDPLMESQSIVLITHTLIAIVLLLVVNATESHAIARAAHRSGLKPVGMDALEGKK